MTVTVVVPDVGSHQSKERINETPGNWSKVDNNMPSQEDWTGSTQIRRLRSALEETRANLQTIFSLLSSDSLILPLTSTGPFIKKASVGVQTDNLPLITNDNQKINKNNHKDNHLIDQEEKLSCCPARTGIFNCCCRAETTICLSDAWELAGLHTRQRMAILRHDYKRLYTRHKRLRRQHRRFRRQAHYLLHQHQILLESIGRQVDNVASDWAAHLKGLLKAAATDPDESESSQLDSEQPTGNHHSLYRWYSSLSLKLSWLQSSHCTVFDNLLKSFD